jgi:hypothetical protein
MIPAVEEFGVMLLRPYYEAWSDASGRARDPRIEEFQETVNAA